MNVEIARTTNHLVSALFPVKGNLLVEKCCWFFRMTASTTPVKGCIPHEPLPVNRPSHFMAGIAADFDVATIQRECRYLVIEMEMVPAIRTVAGRTARILFFRELTTVRIPVARFTLLRLDTEQNLIAPRPPFVTGRARNRPMSTFQGKNAPVMFLRTIGRRDKTVFAMARFTLSCEPLAAKSGQMDITMTVHATFEPQARFPGFPAVARITPYARMTAPKRETRLSMVERRPVKRLPAIRRVTAGTGTSKIGPMPVGMAIRTFVERETAISNIANDSLSGFTAAHLVMTPFAGYRCMPSRQGIA